MNVVFVNGSYQDPVTTLQELLVEYVIFPRLSATRTSTRVSWQSPSASIQWEYSLRSYLGQVFVVLVEESSEVVPLSVEFPLSDDVPVFELELFKKFSFSSDSSAVWEMKVRAINI